MRCGTSSSRGPAWISARPRLALGLALIGVLLVVGCQRSPAERRVTPAANDTTAERRRSQTFIDAGNDAYRAGQFELALKRYAAAAVADPRDPAAYFGMGMTFTRLKREDEARAAFRRAQELSRRESPGEEPHSH